MGYPFAKQVISTFMCAALIPFPVTAEAAGVGQTASPTSSTSAPTVAPLTSSQLDALVAPIALYPDALVAQVLGAAADPEEVAFADDWMAQNRNLQGSALTQAVNQQSWDPSVKALTQFPPVLHDMAKNLSWTSQLGQAFNNQQPDVMAAVQVMRAKAQAAGTLKSSSQVTVVQQSPQTIVIQPANPQVVYVPQYNPAFVFGSPFVVPMYTPPVAVAAASISFGAGVAIGAAFGGGGFVGGASWGFGSWGCNWGGGGGGGNVIYNHNTYVNKTVINRTNINRNTYNRNTANNYHPANTPNGGRNGNHGLIGGNGGVQHDAQQRAGNEQRPGNEQRAGDNQRPGNNMRAANDQRGGGQRGNNFAARQQRASMSGDGNRARAEANRGRASMEQRGGGGGERGGGQRGGGQRGGGGERGRR